MNGKALLIGVNRKASVVLCTYDAKKKQINSVRVGRNYKEKNKSSVLETHTPTLYVIMYAVETHYLHSHARPQISLSTHSLSLIA